MLPEVTRTRRMTADKRVAGQQSADSWYFPTSNIYQSVTTSEELKQLRDRTTHLEQLCRSNGLSVSAAVNSVPDRSIHHPSPSTIPRRRNSGSHGIGGNEHKRAWLNCRKTVRNNLTFDYDVDYASQEKLKVTNCLQVIEYEAALFKRFKGSWGAEYILRETHLSNSNTRNDEDDDPRSSDGVGSHQDGNGGEEDKEQQGNGGDDGSGLNNRARARTKMRPRRLGQRRGAALPLVPGSSAATAAAVVVACSADV
ncbi:hypothetical protein GGX14DRAFT_644442 [Mycena pura]|uniref:Uncharacterized protein n=1 Tax=Mycena pura TaxID=153505 RepID=A0AAD6Y8R6_9AGAR|nr:hypothetical protein GGX14DRAFT_644442 [Mycena pura]